MATAQPSTSTFLEQVLCHSTRAVCAVGSTVILGHVFLQLPVIEGALLGGCGAIAWSVANIACRYFGASSCFARYFSVYASVVFGIPLAGLAYALSPLTPIACNLSLILLQSSSSALASITYVVIYAFAHFLSNRARGEAAAAQPV